MPWIDFENWKSRAKNFMCPSHGVFPHTHSVLTPKCTCSRIPPMVEEAFNPFNPTITDPTFTYTLKTNWTIDEIRKQMTEAGWSIKEEADGSITGCYPPNEKE
jgi:hypothetical protein